MYNTKRYCLPLIVPFRPYLYPIYILKYVQTKVKTAMTKDTFKLLEDYMLSCMTDSAHDKEHVYRVLYHAMDIAKYEKDVDYDVLICACLLHDIGRKEQFENPSLCHAKIGAQKASAFLTENHFDQAFSEKVSHCIQCHRFRGNNYPHSIEAKILFDADKIDVTGAVGIARTLFYKGQVSEPLYTLDAAGQVSTGEKDSTPSFFHEYKYKLEKIYDNFYTDRGRMLALEHQPAAAYFYEHILAEVTAAYQTGTDELLRHLLPEE